MTPEQTAVNALREIRALEFGKLPSGRDDFYSGAPRFITAWLIAHRALEKIATSNPQPGPAGQETA